VGFGVGFNLGPVRVGVGVSSRTLALGFAGMLVIGAVGWVILTVLKIVYIVLTWPSGIAEHLARSAGLDQTFQTAAKWGAVALWAEFLLIVFGLFYAASVVHDLFLGAPGTRAWNRFWRFWAVAMFVPVSAATVGMAVSSPVPDPAPQMSGPTGTSSTPSPTATAASRPPGIPATAQRVRVVDVIAGDRLRVQAAGPGSVLSPARVTTVVRLRGVHAPVSGECRAEWATARLRSHVPRGSYAWIARRAGSANVGSSPAVYLWPEGKGRATVNARLLLTGAARVAAGEVSGRVRERFEAYEARAAAAQRGVHSCPTGG